jgi:hypothetical protein
MREPSKPSSRRNKIRNKIEIVSAIEENVEWMYEPVTMIGMIGGTTWAYSGKYCRQA